MANSSPAIVQKLWNYCNVLRDPGLSHGDYIERLTHLPFLKMAHERTQPWTPSAPGHWDLMQKLQAQASKILAGDDVALTPQARDRRYEARADVGLIPQAA
jgi:hypothetical protein